MLETLKDHPMLITLGTYALIQILKITLKKAQNGTFWKKYREYMPYVAILVGVVISAVFARFFGYTDEQIIELLRDAFYVGGSAVTIDQMLKLPERKLVEKGYLDTDKTNIIN